jgi:N-acetylmuramoyl-L-alanine amidase
LKAWLWLTTLLVLFFGGLAAGWVVADSADSGDSPAPPNAARHGSHLNRKIRKLEEEVDAAGGGLGSVSQTPRHGSVAMRPAEPLSGLTIAVDPGHNGGNSSHPEEIARPVVSGAAGHTKACNTTGTETDDGALTEAQLNFDVAMDLKRRLSEMGARVVMTRTSNAGVGPCVDERAEIANRAGAVVSVSIHGDGNRAAGARGFDVIHALPAEMVEPTMAHPALLFAEKVRDSLVAAGVPPANYVGEDGLDARDDLAGLNLARMPAILVELGNMRSAEEATKLESAGYRERLSRALAAGVSEFLSEAQF